MRKVMVLAGVLILASFLARPTWAIDLDDAKALYKAVGAYFKLSDPEVTRVVGLGVSNDDLPVVLMIARDAHVTPDKVVELRRSGRNWNDITVHFGLTPDIYYVKVQEPPTGPPYGNAYGYYKNKDKHKGGMSDDDVRNMANLKFLSEHYQYRPEEVIKMRSGSTHNNFVEINKEVNINVEKNKGKTMTPGDKSKETRPGDKSKETRPGDKSKGADKTGKGSDKEKGGGQGANSHKGGGNEAGKGGGNSHKGGGNDAAKGGGGNPHKGGGGGGGDSAKSGGGNPHKGGGGGDAGGGGGGHGGGHGGKGPKL